jgi:hypothetical protein
MKANELAKKAGMLLKTKLEVRSQKLEASITPSFS